VQHDENSIRSLSFSIRIERNEFKNDINESILLLSSEHSRSCRRYVVKNVTVNISLLCKHARRCAMEHGAPFKLDNVQVQSLKATFLHGNRAISKSHTCVSLKLEACSNAVMELL